MKRARYRPGVHVSHIGGPTREACERCAVGPVHDGFDVRDRRNLYHRIENCQTERGHLLARRMRKLADNSPDGPVQSARWDHATMPLRG